MTSIASCLINLLSLTDSASQENLLRQHQQNSQSQEEPLTKLSRKKTMRKTFISESGQRVYICYFEECSRHFNHLSSLIKHERIHRDQKPYACSICGFRFTQSSNCKRHEKSHTGEKSYQCSQCPKRFSNSYNLRHHMEIHKQELEGISYSCSGCNKVYTYLSSLIKHRKRCLNQLTKRDNDEKDSPKEISEEETQLKKLIKIESRFEEDSGCSILKEEYNEFNLKRNNSETFVSKSETDDLKIEILEEPKAENDEFDHAINLAKQQNHTSYFQGTPSQFQALPVFSQNSFIPAELQHLVQINSANPSYHMEALLKTAMAHKFLSPPQANSTQVTNAAYNTELFKQLEAIVYRKFLVNTFLSSGNLPL